MAVNLQSAAPEGFHAVGHVLPGDEVAQAVAAVEVAREVHAQRHRRERAVGEVLHPLEEELVGVAGHLLDQEIRRLVTVLGIDRELQRHQAHAQREVLGMHDLVVQRPLELEVRGAEDQLATGRDTGAARDVAHAAQPRGAPALLNLGAHAPQDGAHRLDLHEHALQPPVGVAQHAVHRRVVRDLRGCHRRRVHVDEVWRVGDDPDRALGADGVQLIPVQVAALHRRVQAPGHQRLGAVGLALMRAPQRNEHLLHRSHRRVDALRPGGIDGADVLQRQVAGRDGKVRVRVDQARQDDLVLQRPVDHVLVAREPGLHGLERAGR